MNEKIEPAEVAPPAANYATAVLTTRAARWLHTSGVVPVRPDHSVPDEIAEQADEVWSAIGAILTHAGMTVADIVSVTTYVVHGEPLDDVMAARDRFMGPHRAASTLVTVPALAQVAWKVEIAVVAAAE